MIVDYSGWKIATGAFCHKIFIDEHRDDYAVHYENGTVARQCSDFKDVCLDWNHDGDVYTQFGAWFEYRSPEGVFQGGEFFTPVNLVQMAVDAKDPEASWHGPRVIKVDGVEIPARPRLDDLLAQTENRAMEQEAERNRKMNTLGIQPPNEPWAK